MSGGPDAITGELKANGNGEKTPSSPKGTAGTKGAVERGAKHVETNIVDDGSEQLDVVDDKNKVVGKASRQECHEKGLLHRSTHVFLFRRHRTVGSALAQLQVLVQRRAERKAVGALLWDVSVAEHVSVGERYVQAGLRGLLEELQLSLGEDDLVCIRSPYLSRQVYADVGVHEAMFTETFGAVYDERLHGDVIVDEGEVEAVEWWPVSKLLQLAKSQPHLFTRWLLIELENLQLLQVAKMVTGEM